MKPFIGQGSVQSAGAKLKLGNFYTESNGIFWVKVNKCTIVHQLGAQIKMPTGISQEMMTV